MTKKSGHSYHFSRQFRLVTASDYQNVFNNPKRVSSSDLLFLFCKNNKGFSRLGLAIAKKQFPLAVDRNRIKRLVRESFRELRTQLSSVDIVVMARKNLLNMDNGQTRTQLDKLWGQVIHKGELL
ncbi:MAG: ribonuclease P protein component [Gammaproteobacteria bacterium]|nr:ribonuclease P protein component [Gammaproteobacteria bacterium]